jgi:hypothetical protein
MLRRGPIKGNEAGDRNPDVLTGVWNGADESRVSFEREMILERQREATAGLTQREIQKSTPRGQAAEIATRGRWRAPGRNCSSVLGMETQTTEASPSHVGFPSTNPRHRPIEVGRLTRKAVKSPDFGHVVARHADFTCHGNSENRHQRFHAAVPNSSASRSNTDS